MTSARSARLLPRPKAASRSTRWIHSAPWAWPVQRGVERVAVVRLGAGLALDEADGLAVGDVDGGQQDSRGAIVMPRRLRRAARRQIRLSPASPSQLASRRMPASPDFSGWNCVAVSGPFSTAATKRAPCSAHVTAGGWNGVRDVQVPAAAPRTSARSRSARRSMPANSARALGGVDGVPPHVRQDRGAAARSTTPGHSPSPSVSHAVLDAGLEQDLHAHADAQHGRPPARRRSISCGPRTARKPAMHGGEGTDPGDDQAVGRHRRVVVGGERRPRHRPPPAPARPSGRCPSRSRGPRPAACREPRCCVTRVHCRDDVHSAPLVRGDALDPRVELDGLRAGRARTP